MSLPSAGYSPLHDVLTSNTIDEHMLHMLLRHGASPYIPDESGEALSH